MIRIRRIAPLMISVGLLLLGLSLPVATQGAHSLTRPEMEAFVYTVIGVAGVAVFGSFWVLLTYLNSRTERSVEKIVSEISKDVSELVGAMKDHHLDPLAHPAGSANRINPVMDKIDDLREGQVEIKTALGALLAEHQVIHNTEKHVCALLEARLNSERRRASDPPDFDGTPMREE